MDDLAGKLDSLSIHEARKELEVWLDSTKEGITFREGLTTASRSLRRMGDSRIAKTINNFITGHEWSGHERSSTGLPPGLADFIFGPNNEKILRDESGLNDLIIKDDPVEFALGSYIDAPDNSPRLELIDEKIEKDRIEQSLILDKAFSAPFQGTALEWLKDGLQAYQDTYSEKKHYGKVITIVQSSGMGKSRLVAELSTEEYLVSTCFRGISGDSFRYSKGLYHSNYSPQMGWPPRDGPACDYFVQGARDNGDFYGEELVGAFLGALLKIAADQLESSYSASDFAKKWSLDDPTDVLGSRRHSLFEDVKTQALLMLRTELSGILEDRQNLPNPHQLPHKHTTSGTAPDGMVVGSSAAKAQTSTPPDDDDDEVTAKATSTWCSAIFKRFIKTSASRVIDLCAFRNSSRFILVFDECSELNLVVPDEADVLPLKVMSLFALQRMLKACESMNIWAFLLDTDSGLKYLVPATGELARSHRLMNGTVPLPPYHFLEYDVFARSSKRPQVRTKTMDAALRIKHLITYGRPLWRAMVPKQCVVAASQKLLNNTEFVPTRRDHVLAVFSARLLLELGTGPATSNLALESVRCHMRVLVAILPHGVLQTCAPSEPLLAVAATELLLQKDRAHPISPYKRALSTLVRDLILHGHVLERGLQGELLARIIIMVARDHALPPTSGPNPSTHFVVLNDRDTDLEVQTVKLDRFLHALLGDELRGASVRRGDSVDESEDISTAALLGWASEYHLNFTHFAQNSKIITDVSPAFLLNCWCRGIAIAGTFQQPIYDMLLVAYRGSLDKQFDPHNIGLVSIQVKLQTDAASGDLVCGITCPNIAVDANECWKPPHLAILMDLGTTARFKGSSSWCEIGKDLVKQPDLPDGASPSCARPEPSRFVLNIRGQELYASMKPDGVAEDLKDIFGRRVMKPALPGFQKAASAMEISLDVLAEPSKRDSQGGDDGVNDFGPKTFVH